MRERDENDFESDSDVQWHEPEFLIAHMKEQGKRTGRGDLDESRILELIVDYGRN